MEGRDAAHAFHLVDMPARLDQPLAEQRPAGAVAEQEQAPGFASDVLRAIAAHASGPRHSSARRACGSRKAMRCTPGRRGSRSPPASARRAPMTRRRSAAPRAASSSVGPSLSSMIAAFSGPWGRIRRADRSRGEPGRCSPATIEARRAFRGRLGHIRPRAQVRRCPMRGGGAGFSQSRGSSWTATSTPASSHQPSAARLGNADRFHFPAHGPFLPALTARSRNWQGRRVELCSRRRDERDDERTRIDAI